MTRPNRQRQKGFSLIEIIVALAVLSVAGWVYISFYMSSVDLARGARNRIVAAQLAEEQLGAIIKAPGKFQWHAPKTPNQDPFPITLSKDDPKAGNPVQPPAAMPANEVAFQRDTVLYDQFRWTAQGRLPDAKAGYCEVTVVMHWTDAGRDQIFALTSTVPCAQMPAAGGK